MPKYVFECQDCNIRFERALPMDTHLSHPCPNCQTEAPQVIEGFGFAFKEGQGATANSGVHKQDYPTADQAVGRDAEKRWAAIHERDAVKAAARKQGGTEALIRHQGETFIDYEPMSDTGRKEHFNLAKKAVAAIQRAKAARAK